VYVIRSIESPEEIYIGQTENIQRRMSSHNAGTSPHTSKYRPWKKVVVLEFEEVNKAILFEKYLKTCSGRAMIKKRFL
jgi:putative endonuclease